MPLIHAGKVSALPPDTVIEVMAGDRALAVCNVGGSIHALEGVCVHRGGPLGQGQIQEGRIVCPYHLWEFDCSTGMCEFDSTKALAKFPVSIEGGEILVQVP